MTNNSIFELQSNTKQLTALAILQLVEKGKLTLQDTLSRFFSELPYRNIRLHHLLTHNAGLPDDVEVMAQYWDHKKVASNTDLIQVLASHKVPAHFQPRAKWEYSNTAYELLASIIEKVSGLSYAAYISKNIFDPLGMYASFATTNAVRPKSRIAGYAYGFIYSDSLKKYVGREANVLDETAREWKDHIPASRGSRRLSRRKCKTCPPVTGKQPD